MLTRLDLRGVDGADLTAKLPRPDVTGDAPGAAVQAILADVRARGDLAVRELTERFDGVALDQLRVPQAELDDALTNLSPLLREALEAAMGNILAFHRGQLHD